MLGRWKIGDFEIEVDSWQEDIYLRIRVQPEEVAPGGISAVANMSERVAYEISTALEEACRLSWGEAEGEEY